jgi:hypothetical protein
MTMDLYVYYRAAQSDDVAVLHAVTAMQAALRQNEGVRCGLKRRPPADTAVTTWMEIYLSVAADFPLRLAKAVAASALPGLIDGFRHDEYFLEALPCV